MGGVALDPKRLPPEVLAFLAERHLATLITLRPDGSPHVVPVGFTWDKEAGLVRVITGGSSRKVAHVVAGGSSARAAVCQVDGGRWLTLEGPAVVRADAVEVAEGVRRYAGRYREPRVNPERVVIEISVDRVMGRG
jgi:PPOX class probable F420-dependent enzyme